MKAISFVRTRKTNKPQKEYTFLKTFFKLVLNIYRFSLLHSYCISVLITKYGRPKRNVEEDSRSVRWKKGFHGINLSGVMSVSWKLQLLFSFSLLFSLPLTFTAKSLRRSVGSLTYKFNKLVTDAYLNPSRTSTIEFFARMFSATKQKKYLVGKFWSYFWSLFSWFCYCVFLFYFSCFQSTFFACIVNKNSWKFASCDRKKQPPEVVYKKGCFFKKKIRNVRRKSLSLPESLF